MDVLTFHSDFCSVCGALIELQSISDVIHCQLCGTQLSFAQFAGKKMKTQLVIRQDKQWLHKYDTSRRMIQRKGKSRMVAKQQCPKCGHPQMFYYTAQLRSADQGSTVFYECPNCGHTHSVNN